MTWRGLKVAILLILAGAMLVPGIRCALEWWRQKKTIRLGKTAKPVEMAVDFSEPGKWTGKMFHQYTCFYGLTFSLEASSVPVVATTTTSTLPCASPCRSQGPSRGHQLRQSNRPRIHGRPPRLAPPEYAAAGFHWVFAIIEGTVRASRWKSQNPAGPGWIQTDIRRSICV